MRCNMDIMQRFPKDMQVTTLKNNKLQIGRNADQVAQQQSSPFYLRRKEAAARYQVSLGTWDKWVSMKLIPFIQLPGRTRLFRVSDVDKALDRLKVEVAS